MAELSSWQAPLFESAYYQGKTLVGAHLMRHRSDCVSRDR
jgi:hypothetical protein